MKINKIWNGIQTHHQMDTLLLHIKAILFYAFGYDLLSWLAPAGLGGWLGGWRLLGALPRDIWWPGTVYLNGYYVNTMWKRIKWSHNALHEGKIVAWPRVAWIELWWLGLAGLAGAVLGCARWARGAAWLGSLGGWLGWGVLGLPWGWQRCFSHKTIPKLMIHP